MKFINVNNETLFPLLLHHTVSCFINVNQEQFTSKHNSEITLLKIGSYEIILEFQQLYIRQLNTKRDEMGLKILNESKCRVELIKNVFKEFLLSLSNELNLIPAIIDVHYTTRISKLSLYRTKLMKRNKEEQLFSCNSDLTCSNAQWAGSCYQDF